MIATLLPQGGDVWRFLEQTWIPLRPGGEMPTLVQDN